MARCTTTFKILAIFCTVGLGLTACSTDEATPQQPPSSPTPAATSTTPDEATTDLDVEQSLEPKAEAVGEFSTQPQESAEWPDFGDASNVYPTAVRAAVHEGFERIVIEHAGTGQPSFFAQYTEEPREPGIGTIVDTGDTAYLEVVVSGTATNLEVPEDMLEHGAEITELNTAATGTVTSFAPWEGTSSYIIGLDQKRPYAVSILEDPVRVVVDIQLENQ